MVALAWLAAGLLQAAPSYAQQSEDELLNRCYRLRTRGRFDDALAQCEAAVRTSRTGRSLAQLALTEIALGRWTAAAEHLTQAMADRTHPWVQRNRAVLDEAMTRVRPHVGVLEVEATEPGATVSVNGGDARPLPLAAPLLVAPGSVELDVRSPGGDVVRRTVTLAAGQASREVVTFARAAPPPRVEAPPVLAVTPAATEVRTPPVATTPSMPVVTPPPRPERGGSGSLQRTLAWTAAGGAVAGLGVALVAWRLREGAVSDYTVSCPAGDVDEVTAARCAAPHAQAVSDVGTWETVTTVGLVAGAALAVGSVVLFATVPSSRGGTRTSLRCGAGPGTVGARCGLSF